MSTIKRVLCVALLSATANGLRQGDQGHDPREHFDADQQIKKGYSALLADADTKVDEGRAARRLRTRPV